MNLSGIGGNGGGGGGPEGTGGVISAGCVSRAEGGGGGGAFGLNRKRFRSLAPGFGFWSLNAWRCTSGAAGATAAGDRGDPGAAALV